MTGGNGTVIQLHHLIEAHRDEDRPALSAGTVTVSYAELWRQVAAAGAGRRARGRGRGGRGAI